MNRALSFVFALLLLGAFVGLTSQTGGLPEPVGTLVGQNLSRGVNFVFQATALALLTFGPLRAGESRARRTAWVAGAVALQFAFVWVIKTLVFWPRPVDVGKAVEAATRGSGFPSGHTVPAFLVAVLVGEVAPKFRIPALVMAVLIGYSRVEVTAHFAVQVWLSALIGIGLGLAWSRALPKTRLKDEEGTP